MIYTRGLKGANQHFFKAGAESYAATRHDRCFPLLPQWFVELLPSWDSYGLGDRKIVSSMAHVESQPLRAQLQTTLPVFHEGAVSLLHVDEVIRSILAEAVVATVT